MSLNVEQQEMIERAIFGEEVHNFINSTIGQYIVKNYAPAIPKTQVK